MKNICSCSNPNFVIVKFNYKIPINYFWDPLKYQIRPLALLDKVSTATNMPRINLVIAFCSPRLIRSKC